MIVEYIIQLANIELKKNIVIVFIIFVVIIIVIIIQVNEQLDKMDGVVEAFSVDVLKAKKLVNIGEDVRKSSSPPTSSSSSETLSSSSSSSSS